MTGLVAAETALLESLERFRPRVKALESGPGQWTEAYLKQLLTRAPAIVVGFLSAEAERAQGLMLTTRWAVYVLAGWRGESEEARRRTALGLADMAAAELHHAQLRHTPAAPKDAKKDDAAPEPVEFGPVRVTGIENLWSSENLKAGVALYGIGVEFDVPLDRAADEELDEFLRAGVEWTADGGDGFGELIQLQEEAA